MGFRDILRTIWFGPAYLRARTSVQSLRSFAAAQVDRLKADWTSSQMTVDSDIRNALVIVRSRARERVQNDDYAKRYMQLCRTNVVGHHGFGLQSKVVEDNTDKPDFVANTIIERAWRAWSRREHCSISRRHSFRAIQDMVMRYVARDGEAIIVKHMDTSSRFGLRLEVVPPEALDDLYNIKLPNKNVVKMGVELDPARRPVAYHIKIPKQEQEVFGVTLTLERRRMPARDVLHVFDQEFIDQTRGISWLVTSMARLKMLSGYEEATLVNARVAAAKMGFFVTQPEVSAEYVGEKDANENFFMEAEPGAMEKLPAGLKFESWEPEFPNAQHEAFTKQTLRGIASGLSVSYNMLANDLEKVNFSSIRAGLVDEREMWKMSQQFFIEAFLEPVFESWLESTMIAGAIKLPMAKFEKFNNPMFVGRRWSWVDPLKDVDAKILEVRAGFTTATQVVAEMGRDIEEIYRELEQEKALAKEHGLELKLDEKKAPAAGGFSSEEEEEAMSKLQEMRDMIKNVQEVEPTNGEE